MGKVGKRRGVKPQSEDASGEEMSGFTCISCRVAFADADIQRSHYKTDWHRYNLKRKVADMPPVTAENFEQRLLAQRAQVEEKEKDNSSHCRTCNKHFSTKNAYENHLQSRKHHEVELKISQKLQEQEESNQLKGLPVSVSDENEKVSEKNAKNVALQNSLQSSKSSEGKSSKKTTADGKSGPMDSTSTGGEPGTSGMEVEDDGSDTESWESWDGDALGIEDCFFCPHVSSDMEENIKHMTISHSFFIPDFDYVSDLEGLLTYLGEKIGEGHICLWCNEKSKLFRTSVAVQQHMVDKGHCRMLHEGDTVFEYAEFYDYRSSYPDYQKQEEGGATSSEQTMDEEEEEVDTEDLSEDNYQLVLPSGSVIGHRTLQRYFRQKLRPDTQVVLRNPSAVSRVMAQYKALGWTGTTGPLAQRRAKDIAYVKRHNKKHYMQLGMKANLLQPHFRDHVFGNK